MRTATPEPTRVAHGVHVQWDRFTALDGIVYALQDAVRGRDGWVVIGSCDTECPHAELGAPVASFSVDGSSWASYPLPDDPPGVALAGLHANADGYLVNGRLGVELPRSIFETDLVFWRSPDGRSWTRTDDHNPWEYVGAFRLGTCERDRCPADRGVVLAPSGAILIGIPGYRDERPATGPRVSDDGKEWRLVKPAAFGVDSLQVLDVEATASEVVLAGAECDECPTRLWTSKNGTTWTADNANGLSRVRTMSLARIREVLVAAILGCTAPTNCGLEVWSTHGDGHWSRELAAPDVVSPDVAAAGDTFFLAGRGRDGPLLLASTDGVSWSDVDQTGLGWEDDCRVAFPWVAGGPGTVFVGPDACPVWRGTVE